MTYLFTEPSPAQSGSCSPRGKQIVLPQHTGEMKLFHHFESLQAEKLYSYLAFHLLLLRRICSNLICLDSGSQMNTILSGSYVHCLTNNI